MNVLRNFLETIPPRAPVPRHPCSHRKFHRTLCCALQFYRGFQYPATKPRSRNPRRISLVYFGSTYCSFPLSLTPACSVRAPRGRFLGGRRSPL